MLSFTDKFIYISAKTYYLPQENRFTTFFCTYPREIRKITNYPKCMQVGKKYDKLIGRITKQKPPRDANCLLSRDLPRVEAIYKYSTD